MSADSPDWLWTPTTLESRLADDPVVVLDVRRGEHFANGHIEGARNFSVYGINTYDTDPAPLASFSKMWAFQLSLAGIRREDTVVVCSETSDESAARAFWFLEYLGHPRVALLDGGLRAWRASGCALTRDASPPKSAPYRHETNAAVVAGWQDMLAGGDAAGTVILDTRSAEEFHGEDGRGADRAGAIPGAIHLEWVHNVDADGRLKSAEALRELYRGVGIVGAETVLAYCNTGYRSAHAYVALKRIGHPDVRNYVGSWQEWGNRPECPVVKIDR